MPGVEDAMSPAHREGVDLSMFHGCRLLRLKMHWIARGWWSPNPFRILLGAAFCLGVAHGAHLTADAYHDALAALAR